MGMESTSLSRLLKNMEERELIFRESHPSDKRSVLIKLTPNGLKKRNISRAASLEFNEHVLQELGSDDAKSFFQAMATIERVVEQLRLETDIHTSIKN
jgi:DNA-binding MarR family transcriptional regulator